MARGYKSLLKIENWLPGLQDITETISKEGASHQWKYWIKSDQEMLHVTFLGTLAYELQVLLMQVDYFFSFFLKILFIYF